MEARLKESQKYHDKLTIIVLGLILMLSLYKLPAVFAADNFTNQVMFGLSLAVVLLVVAFVLLSKMQVKIGKKNIKVGVRPFSWTQMKIAKDDIVDMSFFKTNSLDAASNFMHFGSDVKIYNFGDNSGVVMEIKDGRKVVIFSETIYKAKEKLKNMVA